MYSHLVYVPRQKLGVALLRWRNMWGITAVCATAAQRNTQFWACNSFRHRQKKMFWRFSQYAKRNKWASFFFFRPVAEGARKHLSTPHVKLFNFDPPDRRGGARELTPPPSPNAIILNSTSNQTQETLESCPLL